MMLLMPRALPIRLSDLRNLGALSARGLPQIGVTTPEELRRRGAIATYVELKRNVAGVNVNALYALAGALENRHWLEIARARKLELLLQVEDYERARPASGAAANGAAKSALQSKSRNVSSKPKGAEVPVGAADRTRRARQDQPHDELLALRNIGPAMRRDFEQLGIRSVAQLARHSATALYARIQELTDTRHDPCVLDTYAAAIHQARSGEALPWWQFSRERKARAAARIGGGAKAGARNDRGVAGKPRAAGGVSARARSSQQSLMQTFARPSAKLSHKSSAQSSAKLSDKSAAKSSAKLLEKSAGKSVEKSGEKSAEKS